MKRPLTPGVRRDKLPPKERGFDKLSIKVTTKTLFLAYCAGQMPDEVLRRLVDREVSKMKKRIQLNWTHEERPGFDSTGTIAESWFASVGKYSARIDRFTEEAAKADGAEPFAYTVELNGNPIRDGENEPATSFENAEISVLSLLSDRI